MKRCWPVFLLALMLMSWSPQFAHPVAAQSDGALLFEPLEGDPGLPAFPDPAVVRAGLAVAHPEALFPVIEALKSGAPVVDVSLELFPTETFAIRLVHISPAVPDGWSLSGEVVGVPGSEVYVTSQNSGLSLSTTVPGASYEVQMLEGGRYRVTQFNPRIQPPENEPRIPPEISQLPALASNSDDDGSLIDVMVVYTPAARDWHANITGDINTAIAVANQGYANSQITQRMRLVYTAEVNYVEEGGSFDKALDRLTFTKGSTSDPEGLMDEIHQWRDAYAADLVILLIDGKDYCGLAWVMAPESAVNDAFSDYAFAAVDTYCIAPSSYTLAHEAGHIMGAHHDRTTAAGDQGAYPYSYGYWLPNGYYTIMAYSCSGCSRINYFSNPNVSYLSVPTGVYYTLSNSADNRRTLNNTAPVVAKFRDGAAPAPPSGLSGAAASKTQINLSWVDNSSDEAGFKLERAPLSSLTWTEVARPSANVTAYQDSGLLCDTTYRYRVRAYSGNGNSAYSIVISTTTGSCLPNAPAELSASAVSDTRINLSWQDKSDNETGFRVERRTTGEWQMVTTLAVNTTTYQDTGLACDSMFEYRVFAYNQSGDSPASNTAQVSTWTCPPSAPTGLSGSALSQKRVRLTWLASERAEGYRVYRFAGGTTWTQLATLTTGPLEYVDFPLNCGTEFTYRVEAYNVSGSTSSANKAISTNPCVAPPAPTGLLVEPRAIFSLSMQWQDVLDDETSYVVECSLDGVSGWSQVGTVSENQTDWWAFGLATDTPYYYRVTAINAYGSSAPSSVASARTYASATWVPFLGW